MEKQKTKERLSSIRSSPAKRRGLSNKATHTASSSDSESDDFTTVHFKLAAAIEAAAAYHASGLSIDWQSIKSALISEAKLVLEAKSAGKTKSLDDLGITSPIEVTEQSDLPSQEQLYPSLGDDSENSSPHEDDDDDASGLTTLPTSSGARTNCTQLPRVAMSRSAASIIDINPLAAIPKLHSLPKYDPHNPHLQVQLIIKSIVSLTELSLRENNMIEVEIKKSKIVEYFKGGILKNDRSLSPFMDFSNIIVHHSDEEFFTFCSCTKCEEYRELVIHIMVEQFKAAHMVVMLLDVLIKAYGPMLKNVTAYNKFEKLLDANKDIYWITCGFVYNKKSEHLDFIYDESLSDNMIIVLFSSILMVNNPLLLLQILSFHIECIVKAYAEGFLEVVQPDHSKIPAEDMLFYILDGYDDLCRISEQISCYLFAFENDFLGKFSLTWKLLCQRLYQQHVYLQLSDTMLACIITLKEDALTSRHAALIKKYIQFDDIMGLVDKLWVKIWFALNKFNLSETEQKRRKSLLDVYRIFDTVVQDAIAFSLQESSDDNDFYDFQSLENRRLAWQNIMAYTKMKWPDGFFELPNTVVCDEKCKKCSMLLEYHPENCKCISCSLAGGPVSPKRSAETTCCQCLANSLIKQAENIIDSKFLNIWPSPDFVSFVKSNEKRKCSTLKELGKDVTLATDDKRIEVIEDGTYHLAWAVFHHLSDRKTYTPCTIEQKYFCTNCQLPACLLARKILNNGMALELSNHLIHHYQPLTMNREELRSILPNVMLYNRKMTVSNVGTELADVHDMVVKIYWTFIISLYANYFVEFEFETAGSGCLDNLELFNNDIRICAEKLTGNKEDANFEKFLDKIKSLSPFKSEVESDFAFTVDVTNEEIQAKLNDFFAINEKQLNEKIPECLVNLADPPPMITENLPKKTCKDKNRKCCFDHPDIGEHCKENHSTKKRIKKECNHARMNETRERLRKKLTQLVNSRKNTKSPDVKKNTQSQNNSTLQPATLKSAATAAAVNSYCATKNDGKDDSLECLNSLCNRISHLNTTKAQPTGITTQQNNINTSKSTSTKIENISDKEIEVKTESAVTNTSNKNNNNDNNSNNINDPSVPEKRTTRPKETLTKLKNVPPTTSKGPNRLDMVSEIYDFLDNYTKDESEVKKWINETLNYIEGSTSNGNSKKSQPQPMNPKKAAKKAKQKQRKEEEKRILDLQVLHSQFHAIYFKEFAEKYQLKSLKSAKKRDKKKISELEANIKNLQRAKAKVETMILELIATVKQANAEFKFSYLPTKEQQVEKLLEIESKLNEGNSQIRADSNCISSTTATNNLNATSLTTQNLKYEQCSRAHLPNVPYHIGFPPQHVSSYNQLTSSPPLSAPMCFAPPKHSQLAPNFVTTMAANASCILTNDPSKRIVTIRRINLPNVPEPQVTVTAKGSSPEQDKLLYTFVNGQLVHSSSVVPSATQFPLTHVPATTNLIKNNPEHPGVAPTAPLSKTQIKKERKRSAKISMDKLKAPSNKNEVPIAPKCEREAAGIGTCKDKKSSDQKIEITAKRVKKKRKKCKDISPSELTNNSFEPTSATNASSGGSASISATPKSSQNCTRDSSVSSLKPALANHPKNGGNLKKKILQPTAAIEHKPNKLKLQKEPEKTNNNTKSDSPNSKPVLNAKKATKTEAKIQKERIKRSKFVDIGQFDNNPFKSLHAQDMGSDGDYLSACSDDDTDDMHRSSSAIAEDTAIKIKPTPLPTTPEPLPKKGAGGLQKNKLQQGTAAMRNQKQQEQSKQETLIKTKTNVLPSSKNGKNNRQTRKQEQQEHTQIQPIAVKHGNSKSNQQPPPEQKTRTKPNNRGQAQALHKTDTTEPNKSKSNKTNDMETYRRNPCKAQITIAPNSQRLKTETPNTNDVQSKPLSKRAQKQNQQNSKYQQQQQQQTSSYGGIPNNMGYFNAHDFPLALNQEMQALSINSTSSTKKRIAIPPSYASVSNTSQAESSVASGTFHANVSIMDQLNNGVQVENLSLPPGITLTKVDPAKSEELRKKSEEIKKLAKPLELQTQSSQFHQPGATIIAPPASSISSFYGAPYAGVSTTGALDQSGIIMIEAKSQIRSPMAAAIEASRNGKTSKNKKRRNKSKLEQNSRETGHSSVANEQHAKQSKVITLRNPMFHGGPAPPLAGNAATIAPQTVRPPNGLPFNASLVMDQPAAIIKNDNGMFTIRNPALHQAVLGGYRQFGNVNYYTPQQAAAEAAAEAAKARAKTSQQNNATCNEAQSNTGTNPAKSSTFSYFSNASGNTFTGNNNDSPSCRGKPNNNSNTISISCSNIGTNASILSGDAAIIARPTQQTKCISAIGSELKTAQQQKQKSNQSQWKNFGQVDSTSIPLCNTDSLASGSTGFIGNGNPNGELPGVTLQEKYQQSSYYNGFNVFASENCTPLSHTGSLFDSEDCHMPHNCGDDSPPPTITGFNSYLEGIPNTGVIRYDDASFLKNLLPGQHLNNEVSIHNINDSNFSRISPVAHRVEITPVYTNRHNVQGTNLEPLTQCEREQKFVPTTANCLRHEDLGNYGNIEQFSDSNIYVPNNLLNMNELDAADTDAESFERFNYDFAAPTEKQKAMINLEDLLINKSRAGSQRTSPYLDEAALDGFVQNINSLHISEPSDEQCSQLNGRGGINSQTSTTSNWW